MKIFLDTYTSQFWRKQKAVTWRLIKRLGEVLDDLWNLVDESDIDRTKETILAKIDDLQKTIVGSGIQSKVNQMKQRVEQARSADKKVAAKKVGDDKFWWLWW